MSKCRDYCLGRAAAGGIGITAAEWFGVGRKGVWCGRGVCEVCRRSGWGQARVDAAAVQQASRRAWDKTSWKLPAVRSSRSVRNGGETDAASASNVSDQGTPWLESVFGTPAIERLSNQIPSESRTRPDPTKRRRGTGLGCLVVGGRSGLFRSWRTGPPAGGSAQQLVISYRFTVFTGLPGCAKRTSRANPRVSQRQSQHELVAENRCIEKHVETMQAGALSACVAEYFDILPAKPLSLCLPARARP
jgi:hypothetical protein